MTDVVATYYVEAVTPTVIGLASLIVNVPVVVVTSTSARLKDDIVMRVMRMLVISDLVSGAIVCFASSVLAWIGPVALPLVVANVEGFLYDSFTINAFLHLAFTSVVKFLVIVRPLSYFSVFTDRTVTLTVATLWSVNVLSSVVISGVRYTFNWMQFLPVFTAGKPLAMVTNQTYVKIFIVVRNILCRLIRRSAPSAPVVEAESKTRRRISEC